METNEQTNDEQTVPENVKDFLQQLTELTRKTGVGIAGCGCCGSPFTFDLEDDEKHFVYEDRQSIPEQPVRTPNTILKY